MAYKNHKVAIVVPAYNEEQLIGKTVRTMPKLVDYILVVNDGSTDKTLTVLRGLTKTNKRLLVIDNGNNRGVGASLVHGFEQALKTKADVIGVMAGDAQCEPAYLSKMIDKLINEKADYVKANRFTHLDALAAMPTYRRVGNIIITILTKFATGYYSIFDTQNGYGVFTRQTLECLPLNMIGQRYDYENTLLIALSIMSSKVRDLPVPAIYGSEVSTIKVLPTAIRALKVLFIGFWKRIYYKYIVYNFHPIALFLLSSLVLMFFGLGFGIYISYRKIFEHFSPSTGTVMLVVLPIFLGFQLYLSAITMDMNNEDKE